MSAFNDAVQQMLKDETLRCPKCLATNIPNASPTIEVDHGIANCAQCGHTWNVESAA